MPTPFPALRSGWRLGQRPSPPWYVNPDKPSESVLYRTLRWEMQSFMALFSLTFQAVGAGLVFGGLIGVGIKKRETELKEQCERLTTRQTSDGDTTTTEKIWSHQATVQADSVTRDVSGFRIPVRFALPADAPLSGPADQEPIRHVWNLRTISPNPPPQRSLPKWIFFCIRPGCASHCGHGMAH